MTDSRHRYTGLKPTLLGLILAGYIMAGYIPPAGASDEFGPWMPIQNRPVDQQEIRDIITKQLKAISARDADMAYALTTGTFYKKFNTAGEFLREMRFSYRPVYNHESFRFLDQTPTGAHSLIQRVEVSYTSGDPTVVIYKLQKDNHGAWGIDSFTIIDTDEGQPI